MFDRWLVVTDMDGSLLNHNDYDFAAAQPLLQQLDELHIPVILNTSKTYAELEQWVRLLKLQHPFIAENGSAIFIPPEYFPEAYIDQYLADSALHGEYRVLTVGEPIEKLDEFLNTINPPAINFTRCSVEQAMELTGLSETQARLAQTRLFSIPLYFEDNEQEEKFTRQARDGGFDCLKGGRFLHLQGYCNKGFSMQTLRQLYQGSNKSRYGIIAVGDSQNDQAMFDYADIPVVVKSPGSTSLSFKNPDQVIYTGQEAPQGWVEGLTKAFRTQSINL